MDVIEAVGVAGAGFMGSGIAQCAAQAGVEVFLYEPDRAALRRGRDRIAGALAQAVARGRLDERGAADALARVHVTTSLDALAPARVVVEAIVEDAEAKGRLFRELDGRLPDAQLLASNTSSIPIAQLAAQTRRPDRVVGLHFFSPVPAMRLVEVVPAIETAPAAIELAEAVARALGKHPIRAGDRSGFIVNALLVPYLAAAVRMVEAGFARPEDVDEGMRLGAGHPMGPLRLCDLIGLDVLLAVCDSLYAEFRSPEYAPPPLLKRMVLAGRTGRKSGRGFYEYAAA